MKAKIHIKSEWCKGCNICVKFCPTRVLALEEKKAVVKNIEACTACMLCELRCPDFAIQVEKLEKNDAE